MAPTTAPARWMAAKPDTLCKTISASSKFANRHPQQLAWGKAEPELKPVTAMAWAMELVPLRLAMPNTNSKTVFASTKTIAKQVKPLLALTKTAQV